MFLRLKLSSFYSHFNYENHYALRLFDNDILIFSMSNDYLDGFYAHIIKVIRKHKYLLPPDLELSDNGLTSWLKRRLIPKNRAFVHEILLSMGLTLNDTKGILDVCKGLSLNDSYWVVPLGFEGNFSQFNLYNNKFSEILSLVAYTGSRRSHPAFTTSPEFTTNGMLRKAWRKESSGIYLYKGGSEGAVNAGREPYSEFYASQIAQHMQLHHVHYDLVKWKNILASRCKLFTDINTAYIPVGYIVKSGGLKACLDFFASVSDNALDEIKSMLVFDALIYNEDRHFSNFGVLMNSRTCKFIGAAPVFDNGISLFNYALHDDYFNLQDYSKTRLSYYGIPFENICSQVLDEKQRKELKRMIGFRFKRHQLYNLPDNQLRAMEKHIQFRVQELLSLPKKNKFTSRNIFH